MMPSTSSLEEDEQDDNMAADALQGGSRGEPEKNDADEDNVVVDVESVNVEMTPTPEQLGDVSFETNRAGRFSAILVDGAKYR